MNEIIIGSRGSALALVQANWVADKIRLRNPGIGVRVEIIKTKGDKIQDVPLAKIGGRGIFVKEIESALIEGRINAAVHSMKDLPSESPLELCIAAMPPRADPGDVLISLKGRLCDLPQGASIGSSSLRRKAQLLHHRADLQFHDLRGNLDTRIRKLQSGDYDAIAAAAAGLERLGLTDLITEKISTDICLPAAGQGALAVQIREDDNELAEILSDLDDRETRSAVTAERTLLSSLGGGCQVPIAALAVPDGENLTLDAMVADPDGSWIIRNRLVDRIENASELGEHMAILLKSSGADDILSKINEQSAAADMGAA